MSIMGVLGVLGPRSCAVAYISYVLATGVTTPRAILAAYLIVIAACRWARQRYLRSLEGCEDPFPLAYQIAFLEFPFMYDAGTSFGFFNTFAIPSISAVLDHSQGFAVCPQVRYDDTAILMHEVGEFGPRSRRGAAALARVNAIHARWPGIRRDDMAYTLWVFLFEPQRWIERYEWRVLSSGEKDALWRFWREVGVGLNIADLPETSDTFEAWGVAYEKQKYAARPANERLTEAVLLAAARWGPPTSAAAAKEVDGAAQATLEGSASVRLKRRILVEVITALCPNPPLLAAIGLAKEDGGDATATATATAATATAAKVSRVAVSLALRFALALRALFIGLLLPPRPQWWPGTVLAPQANAASSADANTFSNCSSSSSSSSSSNKSSSSKEGEGEGKGNGENDEEPVLQLGCPYHFLSYKEKGTYRLSELGRPASHYKLLQQQQQQPVPVQVQKKRGAAAGL